MLCNKKKEKLMIINRSFWPIYPVIGEALLRFAEERVKNQIVGVILQDHAGIRKHLKEKKRGNGVNFYPCKAWSNSDSGIIRRIFDALFFMFFVFWTLSIQRPKIIYISTDPPVIVPFIVMLYSKIFGAKYIYHLQDIHPEAANVVIPLNKFVFKMLQWMDCATMRGASLIITITEEMANEIKKRSSTKIPIEILPNPSIEFDTNLISEKLLGFTFCGNAGRLQRIPLLIEAIEEYSSQGGKLPFIFAGGGIYSKNLSELAKKYGNVTYKGVITPRDAAILNSSYQWALLPIEDEVTRFAFPSKSSSYVHSGAYIVAICGDKTSVSEWVRNNNLGVTVNPNKYSLVEFFFRIEKSEIDLSFLKFNRDEIKKNLNFDIFISRLNSFVN